MLHKATVAGLPFGKAVALAALVPWCFWSSRDSRALEVMMYLVATHHRTCKNVVYISCLSQAGFGERGVGSDFALLVQAELNPCLEIL